MKIISKHKFTLIELLVVMAIMGILLSMLLPSLGRARYEAKSAVCLSNLKAQGTDMILYASSNNRRYINLATNVY